MTAPGPRTIERAMSAAMTLRAELTASDGTIADDDRLLVDLLDGQTDVFDVLDRIVETSMADGVLADLAAARARRIKARRERLREVATRVLVVLAIEEPIERAIYTAGLSYRSKAIVTDARLLRPALLRTAPDMDAIDKALRAGPEPGAMLSNPMPTLNIRPR